MQFAKLFSTVKSLSQAKETLKELESLARSNV